MQAILKGRTGLAPGMKKVTDWVGRRVETLVDMSNGWGTVKAGTVAEVTYARAGLTLKTEPCACCGLALRITRVTARDVRLWEGAPRRPQDDEAFTGEDQDAP